MKKLILSIALMTAFSGAALAQITGSAHDFNQGQSWNTTGEICIVCHTPHNSQTLPDAPLWNHQLSSQSSYTIYDQTVSGTFDATAGQPDGASKLCLSCHDGTVGLGNFGSTTGNTNYIPGSLNLGTNLSNDHPISFLYNIALSTTDQGLYNPTTTNSGLGGTIQNDLLISDKMQCSSCHDVHNKYNLASLLKVDNTGSALCLTCHNK